ncbi:MAG: hypothetical protein HQM08_15320 [Candidatus Riflebacteria bacterium]|nr:hypothetical protein [Candidatus Riflebacteria bacterium]
MKKSGVTLVETAIAAVVFALFLVSALALFRSGKLTGEKANWIQAKTGSFRNTEIYLNTLIKKASYPCTFVFPSKILENKNKEFGFWLWDGKEIKPSPQSEKSNVKAINGETIFRFTESSHERRGGEKEEPLILIYHFLVLSSDGKLRHEAFKEADLLTSPPEYAKALHRDSIPPSGLEKSELKDLIDDVQSVKVSLGGDPNGRRLINLMVKVSSAKNLGARDEKITLMPENEIFLFQK